VRRPDIIVFAALAAAPALQQARVAARILIADQVIG
jgi:hypothetical protein